MLLYSFWLNIQTCANDFFSWQSCKFKSLCFGIDISIFHIKHCLILEFRIYTDEMTANSDFAILDLRFCLQLVLHALMSPIFLNITENLRSIALAYSSFFWKLHLWFYMYCTYHIEWFYSLCFQTVVVPLGDEEFFFFEKHRSMPGIYR